MKDLLEKLKGAKGENGEKGVSIGVPPFARDLYGDLRDRHLLPLVAILLVAIVAVPFFLDAGDPDLSRTEAQASLPEPVPASARLSVVADVPTLRDYRDRLSELVAKDPFQQHFTAPEVEGAQLGGGATSTTVPTYEPPPAPAPAPSPDFSTPPPVSTAPYQPPAPPISTPPPSTGGAGFGSGGSGSDSGSGSGSDGGDSGDDDQGPAQVRVETKLVSYRMTARLGKPGEVEVRRNIPELTMLPSEKNPLAVFLGVSANEKKALLLVSSEVTSVFGDVRCGFGDETCQLLELEPGFPVIFTYGPDDRRFQITVNKIERVEQDAQGSRQAGAPAMVGARSSAG